MHILMIERYKEKSPCNLVLESALCRLRVDKIRLCTKVSRLSNLLRYRHNFDLQKMRSKLLARGDCHA